MGEAILTGAGGSSAKGNGIPPSVCKNLSINISGTSVSLKWQDPQNTILDKQYLCTWAGTKIVKKLGSYPKSEKDGTLVVDNKIMGQYLNSAYTDTIVSGEDWKYAAFPYSTNGVYCYNDRNKFTEAIIYEFCINPNESNPSSSVTYPVGCLNADYDSAYQDFANGNFVYGDWENAFFQPRPVMLKSDGTVDYEIYKNDFRYKADGVTASDYNNTAYDGNLMIEFPQVWFKYVMDGTLQHVYVANCQVDENYHCYTHINKNGELLDNIYLMAFQPANVSSKLRSLSGQTILTNNAGTTEITYAQANGDSWYIMDFGEFNMIAMLLTLMGKSTNVEAIYGKGRGSSNANATTGQCLTKGMFYGTSATGDVKVFGIENYYANYWKRCAGCVYTATGMKYKMCDYTTDGSTVIGYNADGTGYKTHQTFSGSSGGYISAALLTADGIFPTVASGSATTYFCDGLWWASGGYAFVGGSCPDGSRDGAFCLRVNNALSVADAAIGASLSCKPL